jgi:Ner family transcriptional regulator
MHPTDIVSLIWKRGWSMRQLAMDAGVSGQLVSYALRRPNPTGEKIILDFLGMSGRDIWLDRYDKNGVRIVERKKNVRRPMRGRPRDGAAA